MWNKISPNLHCEFNEEDRVISTYLYSMQYTEKGDFSFYGTSQLIFSYPVLFCDLIFSGVLLLKIVVDLRLHWIDKNVRCNCAKILKKCVNSGSERKLLITYSVTTNHAKK